MGSDIDDKDGVDRKSEDGERVVGNAEAEGETKEVEPTIVFFLSIPPLSEAEEVKSEKEGGNDVRIGLEAVLPMISLDNDGKADSDDKAEEGEGSHSD